MVRAVAILGEGVEGFPTGLVCSSSRVVEEGTGTEMNMVEDDIVVVVVVAEVAGE